MSDTRHKYKYGTGRKILTPKEMLQRLLIAHAQVKASNNSENLLNEIRQIVYSLYQSKQITNKVYNNTTIYYWILYLSTQKIVKPLNLML